MAGSRRRRRRTHRPAKCLVTTRDPGLRRDGRLLGAAGAYEPATFIFPTSMEPTVFAP
jgi:hypothetical protein